MKFSRISAKRSEEESTVLKIGISSDRRNVFNLILKSFQSLHTQRQEDRLEIEPIFVDNMSDLINGTLQGEFDAILPDCAIWFDRIDADWKESHHEGSLISEYTVFAASPIVLVMRASRARWLGYPRHSIGWRDILTLATEGESDFRWSHPSPQSGAGLLATLAMYSAGTDSNQELTEEDINNEAVRSFVRRLEQNIAEYGVSASEVAKRAIQDGRWLVDAFVTEEQAALIPEQARLNDPPIIIYPKEGTLWVEHGIALVASNLTQSVRIAYESLRNYLVSADAQARILASGLRPAASHYQQYLATTESRPLAERHVMPVTAVAYCMPLAAVHKSAMASFRYVKRHINVYLVADVSGSMRGHKLLNAQRGLEAFVNRFESNEEQVGLIVFNDASQELVGSGLLSQNKSSVLDVITNLRAGGGTALLDAIEMAYNSLQQSYDPNRIQAIVVMTDGQENSSTQTHESVLRRRIEDGMNSDKPITVFCIAYGEDADFDLLQRIASAAGGKVYSGTLDNIQRTYEEISHFF